MRTPPSFGLHNVRFRGPFSAGLSLALVVAIAGSARAQAPAATPAPGSGPAPAAAPAAPGTPPPAPPRPAAPPPQGWGPPTQGWAPPPSVAPAPPSAIAPNGEYVSPLSQTTQPVYVPQSVALSGPRFIKDWQDGNPIPWGYHREERARKGEIISGAILFGVPWLYSAFFASLGADLSNGGSNDLAALYVPVLGPFIEMTQTSSSSAHFILALDGVAQGVGAALFFHGLSSPRPLLVRNDLASFMITPTPLGKDGTGVAMMGRF
jgi:hypothetical protein